MKKIARIPSLIICTSGYLVSLSAVILLYRITGKPVNLLTAGLLYDILATFFIFGFSMAFNNSSFYDPYWSVAPIPVLIIWMLFAADPGAYPLRQWLILSLTILWSFRLTFNWIRRWKGLTDEDWRYASFRSYPLPLYWLISLVGFHLFPTLIVFAGCLSVYPALCQLTVPLNIIDVLALVICLSGIAIEMIADRQLASYLRNRKDKTFLAAGLWKYSRHPNYLGEILFWTGLFVFSLHRESFAWYTLAGPAGMILMFSFISIPMMDKRMKERKRGYEEYARKTNALIPLPGKKIVVRHDQ
jgi:steroid 5-alpha reductase family enzyme